MPIDFNISTDYSKEILEAMHEQVEKALTACGLLAEGYAKVNITNQKAVDTGNLRNSITYTVDGNTMILGTNVHYAPYIEFGTGSKSALEGGTNKESWVYYDELNDEFRRAKPQSPRPYLQPAIADHIDTYKQVIEDELKDGE